MVVRIGVLRRVVVMLACAVVAQAASAQDNPANGKALFEGNTVQACTACHANVDNRRNVIDPGGDLDFDFVLGRFLNAIAVQPAMNQFNQGLTTQQKRNIAAYIADVPKARPTPVDYNATAVNSETPARTITFNNAVTSGTAGVASAAPLTINSVGLAGNNPSHFLIKTTTCANSTILAASSSCTVSVSFLTSTSSTKTALLSVNYTQSGVTTTRTAQLNGTVAGAPPPAGSSASGGGGALPAGALGLMLLGLGLRRRC